MSAAERRKWRDRRAEVASAYDRTTAVLTLQVNDLERYPRNQFTRDNASTIAELMRALRMLGDELREIEIHLDGGSS